MQKQDLMNRNSKQKTVKQNTVNQESYSNEQTQDLEMTGETSQERQAINKIRIEYKKLHKKEISRSQAREIYLKRKEDK